MRRFLVVLIFLKLILFGTDLLEAAHAGNTLQIDPAIDSYDLAPYLSYIEDIKGNLTLEQIRNSEGSVNYILVETLS